MTKSRARKYSQKNNKKMFYIKKYNESNNEINNKFKYKEDENLIIIKRKKTKTEIPKIIPRTINQEEFILALENKEKPIVVAIGPAGTGKTLLSVCWAIKEYTAGHFDKIVITRPNVAVDDKDIGFLPGDIFKKMTPWMMPVLDIFKQYWCREEVEMMIKDEIIEICPIAYIRGRTFKNAVIIIDEAQGTTINSMLSILTRLGENSKMIITGDLKQSDSLSNNGLRDFIEKLKRNEKELNYIKLIEMNEKDIERHPAIKEIIKIYS